MLGQTRTCWPTSRRWSRAPSPKGPVQRSQTVSISPAPRRLGISSAVPCQLAEAGSKRSARSQRPPGARRGSSASEALTAPRIPPAMSASTANPAGAPTSQSLGATTRRSASRPASTASSSTSPSSAPPSAGAAIQAAGAMAAISSARGAASAISTAARVVGTMRGNEGTQILPKLVSGRGTATPQASWWRGCRAIAPPSATAWPPPPRVKLGEDWMVVMLTAVPRSARPVRRPAPRSACPRSRRRGSAAGGGAAPNWPAP